MPASGAISADSGMIQVDAQPTQFFTSATRGTREQAVTTRQRQELFVFLVRIALSFHSGHVAHLLVELGSCQAEGWR